MNRRRFLTGVASGAVLATAGCLGYTRTESSEYNLVKSGYTDDTAWIDVEYNGEEEGKVQYELYIQEGDTRIDESSTEAELLTPGETHRLTADMGDTIFDRDVASVGFKIVNTDPPDSNGDVGTVPMD